MRRIEAGLLTVLFGLSGLALGCDSARVARRDHDEHGRDAAAQLVAVAASMPSSAPPPSAPPPSTPSTPPPTPNAPATVERILVPGDSPAAYVRSGDGKGPLTVFLPGVCSNATAYLMTFPEAARAHGGVVAIDGDTPCPGVPGFHTFSWDPMKQHARIEAALAAAGLRAVPKEGITIVGYSQGATIAEKLAYAHPERYARAFIIAAPTDPSIPSFQKTRAVVTGACSLDVTGRMKTARDRLSARGVPSTYVEMPGCTHGNVANGEVTFEAAFSFLRASALPVPAEATSVALLGALP